MSNCIYPDKITNRPCHQLVKKFLLLLSLVTAAALATGAFADSLKIENERCLVQFDKAAGSLSVVDKRSGQNFITNASWQTGLLSTRLCAVERNPFGQGQAIEAVTTSGQVERVMLFPSVPFILLESVLTNATDTAVTVAKLRSLRLPLALGRMPDQLKAMGTAGLTHPAKHTGSYVFLAVADPESRRGVVAGWISHERGDGVIFSGVDNQSVYLDGQVDYGRLVLQPHSAHQGELLAVGCFDDARLGLEAYADTVAKYYAIKLPRQPAGFCTWYSEKHAGASDETNLLVLADFAAKELKPFGFDFIQIDDHWQDGISTNGPKRNFMSAKPGGPYPSGMKATADNIAQLGLTPGIWFMPFAGTSYDPFFASHQDWFYQDNDGKPFETKWGGSCLDMSVPGARDYLKKLVYRIAHEWGYKVFKMDGLWTGTGTRLEYVNNGYKWDEMGEAAPADPAKTQIENYRDGLKLVREVAGPDVFLLGCCVSQNMRSFGGAFGLLDAMRVGPDTGAGHIGAPHASRNYFLNGRVWWNDPDCVSVRAKTPLDQARVNASFTAITGDLFYNSDWMPDLSAERLDILKRTMPAHHLPSRPVDYFENDPARIWHLPARNRDIVAFFNWGDSPTTITCAIDRIGLPAAPEYVAFDFWKNQFLPPFRYELKASLPSGSCRVLAIRPVADHPQLISTSRHITQGIMDVLEEKWDAATATLSGISRVVANDPYELRVVVPVGDNSWHAVAPARQDGPNVRLTFTHATSAEVKWQIKFEQGRVEAAAPIVEEQLPGMTTVSVPQERPSVPLPPSVYLDSLKPLFAKNGWGKLGINQSIAGKPLMVDGKTYAHSLGCHANALVVYAIPTGAKRFVAVVGLDDEQKNDERSSMTFEVYGDVKEMGETPELLAKSPVLSPKTLRTWAFNVELTERHKELRLVVSDAGDGIASDHADWVDAGFVLPTKYGKATEQALRH